MLFLSTVLTAFTCELDKEEGHWQSLTRRAVLFHIFFLHLFFCSENAEYDDGSTHLSCMLNMTVLYGIALLLWIFVVREEKLLDRKAFGMEHQRWKERIK